MPRTTKRTRPNRNNSYYEFPYVRFHGRHYPLIPIRIKKGRRHVNTFALIDSGASMSVFRPEIAQALHIPYKKKTAMRLGTASGGVKISLSKVEIKVEKTKFNIQVGFTEDQRTSFNILGRHGFFPRFSVCFNELLKTIIMVPHHRLPS